MVLEANLKVFASALVAERWNAFGEFLMSDPDAADPSVTQIVMGARTFKAHHFAQDLDSLQRLALAFSATLTTVDFVALPTVGEPPKSRK